MVSLRREKIYSCQRRRYDTKAHDVTGTGSFAGLVLSFYKISSITAAQTQIVSGTKIRILFVAVTLVLLPNFSSSLTTSTWRLFMDKQMN